MGDPIGVSRRGLLFGAAGVAVSTACSTQPNFDYEGTGDVVLEEPARPRSWSTLPEWPDNPATDPAASWAGSDDDVNNIGDPLILTASVILAPGAEGAPNLASLTNPYGLPMELLEVRFSVAPTTNDGATGGGGYRQVTGLGIGVKADLGTIAVTDADVPLSCFGSYRDAVNSGLSTSTRSSWAFDTSTLLAANVPNFVNTYGWRLKYPLYIPGGSTMNLSFHHLSQVQVPVKIWVTYHCRVRAKGYKPAKLMVPWVCSYNSKSFQGVNAALADSDISSELDLLNPFQVPLEVTRLVGSYTFSPGGAASLSATPQEQLNLALPFQYTFVTATSSQGDEVIFSQTPFESLWPTAWRCWDLPDGTHFDPGQWLRFNLTTTAINFDPATNSAAGTYQYAISLVGYREVGGSELAAAASAGGVSNA